MGKRLFTLLLCILAIFTLSCTKTEEKVVAKFGDHVLTIGELKQEYLAISPGARPDLLTIDDKERFATDVVRKEILKIEAQKAGYDRLPQVVEAREATLKRKGWEEFYNDVFKSKVEITEDEMRDLYDRQKYLYHLGWIITRSKGVAEEALRRIRGGESFEKVAGIYSIDSSSEKGGDIGWRPMGTMPANVEEVVINMKPGEISDVLPYRGYFAIIKLFEKKEKEQLPYENSKVGLEAMLKTLKISDLQHEKAQELLRQYNLRFDDDAINFVVSKIRAIYKSDNVPRGELPEFTDEEKSRTLATYDGGTWTIGRFLERVRTFNIYGRPAYGTDADVIKSILQDFITGEIWMLEVEKGGYLEKPEVVKAADRAFEEAMVTAFHDSLVKDVKVDEDKLREFYEENKEQLVTEPSVKLAMIVVETEEEARKIYDELKQGADFAELAKSRSIDTATRQLGGTIWKPLYRKDLEQFPEIEEAVGKLDIGEYSEPMPVPPGWAPEGYMILKVLNKTESRQLSYREIREMLKDRVLEMEQDKVFGEWMTKKMEEYDVVVYPDALALIDFKALKGES